ncbi:MAG: hypothetical protein FWF10_10365 [Clostridiales bacterium]|nr:hypothetical protein [Clostridiales bacterium]
MIWQELANYISERFEVAKITEDAIGFFYFTNDGSEIGMFCSTYEDAFGEWLEVNACVGALSTTDLYKVACRDGVYIINDQIWIRQAYPLSLVIMPLKSGAACETSIRQILYNLSTEAAMGRYL